MDDCLENDDSMLTREPDIKYAVDNVEVVHGYVDEKGFDRRDDSNEDLNQHEQQISHSLDADFRDQISESPEKSYYVAIESDHDNAIETKSHLQERTQSTYNDSNHYQGEMDELHGSNFFKTSSQSKSQTFDNEMGTEDSPNSQESPLTENKNQGAGDSDLVRSPRTGRARNISSEKLQDDSITSSIHEIEKEATDTQTWQSLSSPKSHWLNNKPNEDDSSGENRIRGVPQSDLQFLGRSAGGSISPVTRRQMSISPEGSPLPLHSLHDSKHISSQQGSPDPSYEPQSHRQRISSPQRSDMHTGVFPGHLSPVRQTSVSTHDIRQEPLQDSFAVKHISASLKSHHSHPKYRKRDRSESRSPTRQRGSPSRSRGSPTGHRDSRIRHRDSPTRHRDSYAYQRDYRDRFRSRSPYSKSHHRSRSPYSRAHYRSRSPYSRDHHRSTRRRQSPRRRSPFPEYHNYHRRSPRRTPWSPPPNRKTGLGRPGRNLFVAGFSFLTTERDLERKFSRYGRIQDVRIVRDKRSGDSRGFGFLTLESDEDADAAIRALDETEWNGRIILVEKSKS
ncbi:putative nucleotide-binding alpha-beta plait domain-containing protein [Rosa chinensis]|uniref:Putative nucleotide-binding alpha-beta plait domain-containing protein n=1 Tax=Rosa chinensis TaxID=74649 RepID=A0A2P6QCC2_ROSCH|nr:serine/arginine repetitive matrix protein 2 isoform X1 [Rosa chinensis]PRQ31820.1 putative nucleotide-binding alpha-beta plait domain-containing protein [Rosa chinensis]